MSDINIAKLNDAQRVELLKRLASMSCRTMSFKFETEFGLFLANANDDENDAETLRRIKKGYIDRFNGKVIKADLSGDMFNSTLYNRDNGEGAAEQITSMFMMKL